MQTAWDWITLALFCALAVLFLQRSVGPARRGDHPLAYLPPSLGCAGANWLGNEGRPVWATVVLLVTLGYIAIVLLRRR
jgi:hypothetical protein